MAKSKKFYYVIIEHNKWQHDKSKKPPTKLYQWLEKMTGIRARSNRGQGDDTLVQEGAIRTSSYDFAIKLRTLLLEGLPVDKRGGGTELYIPDDVRILEAEELEVHTTAEDIATARRLRTKFGKRGRKTVSDWAVTCHEEGITIHSSDTYPILCPSCTSSNIEVRPGYPTAYRDPGGSVLDGWLRTRFAEGHWELADNTPDTNAPELSAIKISNDDEKAVVRLINESGILDKIAPLKRDDQMLVLDALLVGRTHWPHELRNQARREAFLAYIEADGASMTYSLAERKLDLFSAAGPLEADDLARFARLLDTE